MFTLYETGKILIEKYKSIFDEYPIETAFIKKNAENVIETTRYNYCCSVEVDGKYLICAHTDTHPITIFGDSDLVNEMIDGYRDYNLYYDKLLAPEELGTKFFLYLESKMRGTHKKHLSMEIMKCTKTNDYRSIAVEKATDNDIDELTQLTFDFYKAAVGENTMDECKNLVVRDLANIFVVRENGKIIATTKKSRDMEKSCCISLVYTVPEYRGKGIARSLVGYVTDIILLEGKQAYLFVDQKNPISNHIYSTLGYEYITPMIEYHYEKSTIKTVVLAGGCFWCASKPYYEIDGVRRVLSGYAGGSVFNPKYEEVKHGDTGHKEAILIEYDEVFVNYEDILDIYFDTIDPFDDGGQFIDRGDNYTCAVFSDDKLVRAYSQFKLHAFEEYCEKKTFVPILPEVIFYKAEEYHQDFALKNPEKMEEELVSSGRKNR